MPALLDLIVDGADPFHIWPEARRARKVERKMGAQTAWFRRWIDEMPKGMFDSIGKIIAFRESDGRNEPAFQIFGNGGDFMGEERSEEHTSELQSLMRRSSAVFCLTTQD